MTEFTFSDNELRLSAISARNAILASLPEPESCNPEFSNTFLEKMNMLLRLDKKRTVHKRRIRRLVAAILALMIATAALITFHPTIRATVQKWLRTTFGSTILYHYIEEQPADALPNYSIGWLPEGYTLVDSYEDPACRYLVYQNKDEQYLYIDFNAMFDGTLNEMEWDPDLEYNYMHITVNDCPADLYIVPDQSVSSDLLWFDEDAGVAFQVSGFLSKDELIRIAENIKEPS